MKWVIGALVMVLVSGLVLADWDYSQEGGSGWSSYGDVVGGWTGCDGTNYLRSDGNCTTPAGGNASDTNETVRMEEIYDWVLANRSDWDDDLVGSSVWTENPDNISYAGNVHAENMTIKMQGLGDYFVGVEWNIGGYGSPPFATYAPLLQPRGYNDLFGTPSAHEGRLYIDGNLFIGNFGLSGQPGRIYMYDVNGDNGVFNIGYNNLSFSSGNSDSNIIFKPQDTVFFEPQIGGGSADYLTMKIDGNIVISPDGNISGVDNLSIDDVVCLQDDCITAWPVDTDTNETGGWVNTTLTTTTSLNVNASALLICDNGTATIMTRNRSFAESYGCVV